MRPIDPAELSALIDGELDDSRAAEVRAALAGDEALRARYAELTGADAHLRSIAAGVELSPRIRLPSRSAAPAARPAVLWPALPVVVIAAAWLTGKLTEPGFLSVAASALAFLVMLLYVVPLILKGEDGPDAPLQS